MNLHRSKNNVVPEVDLITLDIDGTATIEEASHLMKPYTWLLFRTKSHTEESHRFRMVFPLSHRVPLDYEGFKAFMKNIYAWLPFPVDTAACDLSRAWGCNPDPDHIYNDGELLSVWMFLPHTRKAEEVSDKIKKLRKLDSLQRWFAIHAEEGNRNNMLYRYKMYLEDQNYDTTLIATMVREFNSRLTSPLRDDELQNTVLRS